MWTLILTGLIIFMSALVFYFRPTERVLKPSNVPVAVATIDGISNVVRTALNSDGDWNDCSGVDKYCDESDSNGFFPIYSESLDSKLEKVETSQGFTYTAKMKPIDSDNTYVVIEVEGKGLKYLVGYVISRPKENGDLPLIYGSSFSVLESNVCSYFWNGKEISGITKPALYIFEKDSSWYPEIVNSDSPAGNNPKNVVFATDFHSRLVSSTDIDKFYTTDELDLEKGAHLKLAYSDKTVWIDDSSSADEVVEHGTFQFPDFNDQIGKITDFSNSDEEVDCNNENLRLIPGDYGKLKIEGSCSLYLSEGVYRFKSLNLGEGNVLRVYYSGDVTFNVKDLSFSGSSSSLAQMIVSPDGVGKIKIEGDDFYSYYGKFECKDNPENCMIDVNDYTGIRSTIWGFTTLARDNFYASYSLIVGNVYSASNLTGSHSTFCNVVDSLGRQLYAGGKEFLNLVAPDGIVLPHKIVSEKKVVCVSEEDCLSKLKGGE